MFSGKSLYIAIGTDDPKTELLEAHRVFTNKLINREYEELQLMNTELSGRGHYDIPEFGFSEGLTWLFSEKD